MNVKEEKVFDSCITLISRTLGTDDQILIDCINEYRGSDRHYHGTEHITDLLTRAFEDENIEASVNLMLSILYHDVVYDALRTDNEDRSADRFVNDFKPFISKRDLADIELAIRETKHHIPTTPLSKDLCDLDMQPVYEGTFELFKNNLELLRKEYHMFTDREFFCGHLKFFLPFRNISPEHQKYVAYLIHRTRESRKGQ